MKAFLYSGDGDSLVDHENETNSNNSNRQLVKRFYEYKPLTRISIFSFRKTAGYRGRIKCRFFLLQFEYLLRNNGMHSPFQKRD